MTDSHSLSEQHQRYNLRLLAIMFLFTTFSGAIRKWVLTDSLTSNALLGIQIGMPLVFVVLARTKPLSRSTFGLIIGFTFLLILMAVNPMNQTIFHGIIGYFLHAGVLIPLLVYLNDRDAFPVEKLTTLFLIVAGVETVLGIVQFYAPPESFINKYVREEATGIAITIAGGHARITGTFSYLGGMSPLFIFFATMVWGMRVAHIPIVRVFLLMAICLVISPMTGSRGLILFVGLYLLISLFVDSTNIGSSLALVVIAVFAFVLYQYTSSTLVSDAFEGILGRFENAADGAQYANGRNENLDRVTEQYEKVINFRGAYPFLGTGLGGTYQGAKLLFGESPYLLDYGYYESEPERIVLEGGYLLFLVRLLLWGLIIRWSRIPFVFGLLLFYLNVFNTVTVFNVFSGFYTLLGFLYLDRCYYSREQKSSFV